MAWPPVPSLSFAGSGHVAAADEVWTTEPLTAENNTTKANCDIHRPTSAQPQSVEHASLIRSMTSIMPAFRPWSMLATSSVNHLP